MRKNEFSKRFRLKARNDFMYLKEGSLKRFTPSMAIYFKRSRLGQSETRVGLAVSKKTGCSVKRNRFKRILRETFRASSQKFIGIDGLIVINPSFVKKVLNQEELEKILKDDFCKLLSDASYLIKRIPQEKL
ncbi:MAG: ribonuclease P protein component [Oligoflexia bacterium]|nr:ribonuclease P protein component [Oligoflexia bacterium]